MSESYEKLVRLVEEIREDVEKAESGNKSAAVRVRKQMQEIKKVAQDIRGEMMELKKAKSS